jgi:osmotically-inducible protein OsmY
VSDFQRTFQKNFNYKRLMLASLAAGAVISSLTACAPLVVGSAVMSGLVAIDRRTTGIQLEDEGIELRTAQGLRQNLSASAHVNVTSYNRMVLLTGEVGSAADKERAEKLAKSQENVSSVVNDLAIEPASSLTQRSKDAVITGQVKALLVDAKDLQSNAFKVITERGVVYLMGRVTSREAQRASEIARSSSIGGVVKVVRVFDIITEEELKRISAQPLSPQAQPKL